MMLSTLVWSLLWTKWIQISFQNTKQQVQCIYPYRLSFSASHESKMVNAQRREELLQSKFRATVGQQTEHICIHALSQKIFTSLKFWQFCLFDCSNHFRRIYTSWYYYTIHVILWIQYQIMYGTHIWALWEFEKLSKQENNKILSRFDQNMIRDPQ